MVKLLRQLVPAILVVSVVMSFAASTALASEQEENMISATVEGQNDGQAHATGALVWSAMSMTFLGPVAAGASVVYYYVQSPEPRALDLLMLCDKPFEYKVAYLEAYEKAAKAKMVRNSLIGAAVGTVGTLIWYSFLDGAF